MYRAQIVRKMNKYKVGDILVEKEAQKGMKPKMFEVIDIKKDGQFPIVTKAIPYNAVQYGFTEDHADELLNNLGNDLSRVLYENP